MSSRKFTFTQRTINSATKPDQQHRSQQQQQPQGSSTGLSVGAPILARNDDIDPFSLDDDLVTVDQQNPTSQHRPSSPQQDRPKYTQQSVAMSHNDIDHLSIQSSQPVLSLGGDDLQSELEKHIDSIDDVITKATIEAQQRRNEEEILNRTTPIKRPSHHHSTHGSTTKNTRFLFTKRPSSAMSTRSHQSGHSDLPEAQILPATTVGSYGVDPTFGSNLIPPGLRVVSPHSTPISTNGLEASDGVLLPTPPRPKSTMVPPPITPVLDGTGVQGEDYHKRALSQAGSVRLGDPLPFNQNDFLPFHTITSASPGPLLANSTPTATLSLEENKLSHEKQLSNDSDYVPLAITQPTTNVLPKLTINTTTFTPTHRSAGLPMTPRSTGAGTLAIPGSKTSTPKKTKSADSFSHRPGNHPQMGATAITVPTAATPPSTLPRQWSGSVDTPVIGAGARHQFGVTGGLRGVNHLLVEPSLPFTPVLPNHKNNPLTPSRAFSAVEDAFSSSVGDNGLDDLVNKMSGLTLTPQKKTTPKGIGGGLNGAKMTNKGQFGGFGVSSISQAGSLQLDPDGDMSASATDDDDDMDGPRSKNPGDFDDDRQHHHHRSEKFDKKQAVVGSTAGTGWFSSVSSSVSSVYNWATGSTPKISKGDQPEQSFPSSHEPSYHDANTMVTTTPKLNNPQRRTTAALSTGGGMLMGWGAKTPVRGHQQLPSQHDPSNTFTPSLHNQLPSTRQQSQQQHRYQQQTPSLPQQQFQQQLTPLTRANTGVLPSQQHQQQNTTQTNAFISVTLTPSLRTTPHLGQGLLAGNGLTNHYKTSGGPGGLHTPKNPSALNSNLQITPLVNTSITPIVSTPSQQRNKRRSISMGAFDLFSPSTTLVSSMGIFSPPSNALAASNILQKAPTTATGAMAEFMPPTPTPSVGASTGDRDPLHPEQTPQVPHPTPNLPSSQPSTIKLHQHQQPKSVNDGSISSLIAARFAGVNDYYSTTNPHLKTTQPRNALSRMGSEFSFSFRQAGRALIHPRLPNGEQSDGRFGNLLTTPPKPGPSSSSTTSSSLNHLFNRQPPAQLSTNNRRASPGGVGNWKRSIGGSHEAHSLLSHPHHSQTTPPFSPPPTPRINPSLLSKKNDGSRGSFAMQNPGLSIRAPKGPSTHLLNPLASPRTSSPSIKDSFVNEKRINDDLDDRFDDELDHQSNIQSSSQIPPFARDSHQQSALQHPSHQKSQNQSHSLFDQSTNQTNLFGLNGDSSPEELLAMALAQSNESCDAINGDSDNLVSRHLLALYPAAFTGDLRIEHLFKQFSFSTNHPQTEIQPLLGLIIKGCPPALGTQMQEMVEVLKTPLEHRIFQVLNAIASHWNQTKLDFATQYTTVRQTYHSLYQQLLSHRFRCMQLLGEVKSSKRSRRASYSTLINSTTNTSREEGNSMTAPTTTSVHSQNNSNDNGAAGPTGNQPNEILGLKEIERLMFIPKDHDIHTQMIAAQLSLINHTISLVNEQYSAWTIAVREAKKIRDAAFGGILSDLCQISIRIVLFSFFLKTIQFAFKHMAENEKESTRDNCIQRSEMIQNRLNIAAQSFISPQIRQYALQFLPLSRPTKLSSLQQLQQPSQFDTTPTKSHRGLGRADLHNSLDAGHNDNDDTGDHMHDCENGQRVDSNEKNSRPDSAFVKKPPLDHRSQLGKEVFFWLGEHDWVNTDDIFEAISCMFATNDNSPFSEQSLSAIVAELQHTCPKEANQNNQNHHNSTPGIPNRDTQSKQQHSRWYFNLSNQIISAINGPVMEAVTDWCRLVQKFADLCIFDADKIFAHHLTYFTAQGTTIENHLSQIFDLFLIKYKAQIRFSLASTGQLKATNVVGSTNTSTSLPSLALNSLSVVGNNNTSSLSTPSRSHPSNNSLSTSGVVPHVVNKIDQKEKAHFALKLAQITTQLESYLMEINPLYIPGSLPKIAQAAAAGKNVIGFLGTDQHGFDGDKGNNLATLMAQLDSLGQFSGDRDEVNDPLSSTTSSTSLMNHSTYQMDLLRQQSTNVLDDLGVALDMKNNVGKSGVLHGITARSEASVIKKQVLDFVFKKTPKGTVPRNRLFAKRNHPETLHRVIQGVLLGNGGGSFPSSSPRNNTSPQKPSIHPTILHKHGPDLVARLQIQEPDPIAMATTPIQTFGHRVDPLYHEFWIQGLLYGLYTLFHPITNPLNTTNGSYQEQFANYLISLEKEIPLFGSSNKTLLSQFSHYTYHIDDSLPVDLNNLTPEIFEKIAFVQNVDDGDDGDDGDVDHNDNDNNNPFSLHQSSSIHKSDFQTPLSTLSLTPHQSMPGTTMLSKVHQNGLLIQPRQGSGAHLDRSSRPFQNVALYTPLSPNCTSVDHNHDRYNSLLPNTISDTQSALSYDDTNYNKSPNTTNHHPNYLLALQSSHPFRLLFDPFLGLIGHPELFSHFIQTVSIELFDFLLLARHNIIYEINTRLIECDRAQLTELQTNPGVEVLMALNVADGVVMGDGEGHKPNDELLNDYFESIEEQKSSIQSRIRFTDRSLFTGALMLAIHAVVDDIIDEPAIIPDRRKGDQTSPLTVERLTTALMKDGLFKPKYKLSRCLFNKERLLNLQSQQFEEAQQRLPLEQDSSSTSSNEDDDNTGAKPKTFSMFNLGSILTNEMNPVTKPSAQHDEVPVSTYDDQLTPSPLMRIDTISRRNDQVLQSVILIETTRTKVRSFTHTVFPTRSTPAFPRRLDDLPQVLHPFIITTPSLALMRAINATTQIQLQDQYTLSLKKHCPVITTALAKSNNITNPIDIIPAPYHEDFESMIARCNNDDKSIIKELWFAAHPSVTALCDVVDTWKESNPMEDNGENEGDSDRDKKRFFSRLDASIKNLSDLETLFNIYFVKSYTDIMESLVRSLRGVLAERFPGVWDMTLKELFYMMKDQSLSAHTDRFIASLTRDLENQRLWLSEWLTMTLNSGQFRLPVLEPLYLDDYRDPRIPPYNDDSNDISSTLQLTALSQKKLDQLHYFCSEPGLYLHEPTLTLLSTQYPSGSYDALPITSNTNPKHPWGFDFMWERSSFKFYDNMYRVGLKPHLCYRQAPYYTSAEQELLNGYLFPSRFNPHSTPLTSKAIECYVNAVVFHWHNYHKEIVYHTEMAFKTANLLQDRYLKVYQPLHTTTGSLITTLQNALMSDISHRGDASTTRSGQNAVPIIHYLSDRLTSPLPYLLSNSTNILQHGAIPLTNPLQTIDIESQYHQFRPYHYQILLHRYAQHKRFKHSPPQKNQQQQQLYINLCEPNYVQIGDVFDAIVRVGLDQHPSYLSRIIPRYQQVESKYSFDTSTRKFVPTTITSFVSTPPSPHTDLLGGYSGYRGPPTPTNHNTNNTNNNPPSHSNWLIISPSTTSLAHQVLGAYQLSNTYLNVLHTKHTETLTQSLVRHTNALPENLTPGQDNCFLTRPIGERPLQRVYNTDQGSSYTSSGTSTPQQRFMSQILPEQFHTNLNTNHPNNSSSANNHNNSRQWLKQQSLFMGIGAGSISTSTSSFHSGSVINTSSVSSSMRRRTIAMASNPSASASNRLGSPILRQSSINLPLTSQFEHKARHIFRTYGGAHPKQLRQVDMSNAMSSVWRLRDHTSIGKVPCGVDGRVLHQIQEPFCYQPQPEEEGSDDNDHSPPEPHIIDGNQRVLHYERVIESSFDVNSVVDGIESNTEQFKGLERAILLQFCDPSVAISRSIYNNGGSSESNPSSA